VPGDTGDPGSLSIGSPSYEGAGCAGAKAGPAEEPRQLEVRFPAYRVRGSAGPAVGAACEVRLPVAVPAGVAIRLVGASWSGRARLGEGGGAELRQQYFLDPAGGMAGTVGALKKFEFSQEYQGAFFFSDDLREDLAAQTDGWTACAPRPTRQLARVASQLRASGVGSELEVNFVVLFRIEARRCAGEAR
jgi:hypothetical protein